MAIRSALLRSPSLPLEARQTVAISQKGERAKMSTWEYRESIVTFVCAVAAQICAMPTDSNPRNDRAVKMVESGELSAKAAAAEAVGLGPEEAGSRRRAVLFASAQHAMVSFGAFPRQVVMWAVAVGRGRSGTGLR